MARIVERLWTDENGNSVVDWMVLAAGVLMLGTAVFATVTGGSRQVAQEELAVVSVDGA
ncbi:hypothetical protein [Pelagovum pacificum]|uniref:hypothetical protein n=1 Tax=Pelagovum pacificum TaxID=2588711 RepID=UPI0018CF874C|nr:hypothetical protein [Pelagovum pacificum]QQA43243.1 hypothetical protein I8N54_01325 [Pelagovum pacificum]